MCCSRISGQGADWWGMQEFCAAQGNAAQPCSRLIPHMCRQVRITEQHGEH